jgi:hypothetical protein
MIDPNEYSELAVCFFTIITCVLVGKLKKKTPAYEIKDVTGIRL